MFIVCFVVCVVVDVVAYVLSVLLARGEMRKHTSHIVQLIVPATFFILFCFVLFFFLFHFFPFQIPR